MVHTPEICWNLSLHAQKHANYACIDNVKLRIHAIFHQNHAWIDNVKLTIASTSTCFDNMMAHFLRPTPFSIPFFDQMISYAPNSLSTHHFDQLMAQFMRQNSLETNLLDQLMVHNCAKLCFKVAQHTLCVPQKLRQTLLSGRPTHTFWTQSNSAGASGALPGTWKTTIWIKSGGAGAYRVSRRNLCMGSLFDHKWRFRCLPCFVSEPALGGLSAILFGLRIWWGFAEFWRCYTIWSRFGQPNWRACLTIYGRIGQHSHNLAYDLEQDWELLKQNSRIWDWIWLRIFDIWEYQER